MEMQFSAEQLSLLAQLINAAQEQIDPEAATFDQKVNIRARANVKAKVEKYQKKLERHERINSCFLVALEQHLPTELAQYAVDNLDAGRRRSCYSTMIKVYNKADTLQERNMLKAASAIYRRHFTDPSNKSYIYQMNSIINFTTACDHCGQLAQQITSYLDNCIEE